MSGTLAKWINSENALDKTVLSSYGDGTAGFRELKDLLTTSLPVFSGSFYTSSTPYVEYASTPWKAVMQFPYIGSDVLELTFAAIVASKSNAVGSAHFRIVDLTNGTPTVPVVIAEITWTAEDMDIYTDDTLTNLPTTAAIFEVQIRDVGATKPRLHSLMVF